MSSEEGRWKLMSRKVIGKPGNPMLIRWRVLQTPRFGIYVHFIHREDLDRLPHDHPWTFWTWIIRGSYEEDLWPDARLIGRPALSDGRVIGNQRPRWSFRCFDKESAHHITKVNGKLTTLVLVGPKNRDWGFYDGAGSFIPWREYHAVAPQYVRGQNITDASMRVCMGCGTADCLEGRVPPCPDRRLGV